MPGTEQDLKIPERTISPEYEGPQLFPTLRPLDVVPRPPTPPPPHTPQAMRDFCSEGLSPASSTPPAQLERQTLGRRTGRVVCSTLVGPSAGFLAAIQIIHRNQACKTRSHPLLMLQPTFLGVGRVWDGRQGGNGSWPGERKNQLEPFLAPPARVHSWAQLPREQKGVPGVSLHRWSGHMVQGGWRGWVGGHLSPGGVGKGEVQGTVETPTWIQARA